MSFHVSVSIKLLSFSTLKSFLLSFLRPFENSFSLTPAFRSLDAILLTDDGDISHLAATSSLLEEFCHAITKFSIEVLLIIPDYITFF